MFRPKIVSFYSDKNRSILNRRVNLIGQNNDLPEAYIIAVGIALTQAVTDLDC